MPRPRLYRDYEDGYDLIHGEVSPWHHQPPPEQGRLVATLWLPNPEYRSGFNEWPIYAAAPKTRRRRLGYGHR